MRVLLWFSLVWVLTACAVGVIRVTEVLRTNLLWSWNLAHVAESIIGVSVGVCLSCLYVMADMGIRRQFEEA